MSDISVIDGVFGKRYGEVLLVRAGQAGPEATVYNTFPLNDCPAELWDALDAEAIAEDNGAVAALLNGPRYWLMSSIGKADRESMHRKIFGGLEMNRQATVALSSMNPAPYNENRVDRKAVFTFDAGREIYELVDPKGRRWIMQTYSQTVVPKLSLADLSALASRLSLPPGWTYEASTPTSPDERAQNATELRRVVCKHALSVIVVVAAVAVVGFFPSGVWLKHALPPCGVGIRAFCRHRMGRTDRRDLIGAWPRPH